MFHIALSAILFSYTSALYTNPPSTPLFTVEDDGGLNRHLHRIRHARDSKAVPYKSATSTLTNPSSDHLESFSLNCPHVADASNENVRVQVTWTLNDTIWLKIEDGEKKIYNRMTTFNKRTVAGKTVLRVLLNHGRYFFDYDELTGDFAMEIRPVYPREDVGVWQCHVTVYQKGNTHTLTSRSRVKQPHQHRAHKSDHTEAAGLTTSRHFYDLLPFSNSRIENQAIAERKEMPQKMTSFTRQDQESVQISRDNTKRRQTVVFDRQQPLSKERHHQQVTHSQAKAAAASSSSSHAQAAIDYELSMADQPDEQSFYYGPRSRARSAYMSDSASTTFYSNSYLCSLSLLLLVYLSQ